MTIRHLDFHQTVLIHDIGIFNDAALGQNKGSQSVDVVGSESPRHGPCGHAAVDEIEQSRHIGHIARWCLNRISRVECAHTSGQTRERELARASLSMTNSTLSSKDHAAFLAGPLSDRKLLPVWTYQVIPGAQFFSRRRPPYLIGREL